MRRIHFLRGLLALPIGMPIVTAPFAALDGFAQGPFLVSVVALYFGILPYLAFVLCVAWFLRRSEAGAFARFLVRAPIWFLIPTNLGVLHLQLNSIREPSWFPYALSSLFVLAVGYAYVGIGWALYRLAAGLRLFAAPRAASP